jgi:hypothetical protein
VVNGAEPDSARGTGNERPFSLGIVPSWISFTW